jgi:hypothetical protein
LKKIKGIVPRFLIFENNVNVCTKSLAWVRVERRREWLGPKHAKVKEEK